MRIQKSFNFDAAHFLQTAEESERPYARMHGHSFAVDVEIEGEPDPRSGWVADFADIADALDRVRDDLDHRLLNDVEGLERPTLEYICLWIFNRLIPTFPGLCKVSVARPSNGERCTYEP